MIHLIDFETFCKQTLHCYACNFAAETSIPEVLHFSQFFSKFAKIVMLILISWFFLISTKNIWPRWYTTAEDFKALDADSLIDIYWPFMNFKSWHECFSSSSRATVISYFFIAHVLNCREIFQTEEYAKCFFFIQFRTRSGVRQQ